MDQHHEVQNGSIADASGSRSRLWVLALVIALIGAAALGVGYGMRQQGLVSQMSVREADNAATISQMRGQIDLLTAKLNELSAAEQQRREAAQPAQAPVATAQPAARTSGTPRGRTAPSSKQMKQLQAQLSEQQKQLQDTRDALDKTRSDLETSLSATRDDLNGSIARTHEEVVALSKRGERSISEFDLVKHAGFERSGPVSLSLRKADTKHQRFDVNLIVDDVQLTKKSVNLYEPIWIHRADDPQPVQIVINKIEKDHVRGYVSAPKYRQSELTTISYSPLSNSTQTSPQQVQQPDSPPSTSPASPPHQ